MVNVSGALSAGQIQNYYDQSYAAGQHEYLSEGETIRGHWQGQLAADFGLRGDVDAADLQRLANGQSPDGEQRIQIRDHHRAGWDATFSAPKSISLVALVGGDERVREAHREAVKAGVETFERYTQAHVSANTNETTGRMAAAVFEHDSARPVDSYSAPQLHSHVVIQNMTQTADGRFRSLADRELFRTQQLATAVYRSELTQRVEALGYRVEVDAHGAPQIAGISQEYMQASSPRRQQIEAAMQAAGVRGADAAQIAAHQTRDAKTYDRAGMLAQHREIAARFGQEATRAVEQAQSQGARLAPVDARLTAVDAVEHGIGRNIERSARVDERRVLADALTYKLGAVQLADVTAEVTQRLQTGWLIERPHGQSPARQFTTPDMVRLEQDTIATMTAGRGQHRALGEATQDAHLSVEQRAAASQVLANTDRVQALDGRAGVGKTTTLAAVRIGAEQSGYEVVGLAPHSRAVQELQKTGMQAHTLQHHLQHVGETATTAPRLYVLDESSLASTRQMHHFLHTLKAHDRVLLVGDTKQHESVEAGRPFVQLQEQGMSVARLETIIRQKPAAYRAAVEQLAAGNTREALRSFPVHEIPDRSARLHAVAAEYLKDPAHTLVVAPDHRSRIALNEQIHDALVERGDVKRKAHRVGVLVSRQDLTGPDRMIASNYHPGDVVRYTKRSEEIAAGTYARVEQVDAKRNTLTVQLPDGRALTYDPGRRSGVSVYSEHERSFSVGDRITFTQPSRELGIANGDRGEVAAVNGETMRVTVNGRSVGFRFDEYRHVETGYAVTSHSSQGSTAEKVILHVDTDHAKAALSMRTAYVGLSRGVESASIYTNDAHAMTEALSRDVSHTQALEHSAELHQGIEHAAAAHIGHGHGAGHGMSH